MSLNEILAKSKKPCKYLVEELLKKYEYVSLLGSVVTGTAIGVDTKNISVSESANEVGYVVKIFNGKGYSEYSFDDINEENYLELAKKIEAEIKKKK